MSKPKNLDECAELARKKEPFIFNNVFASARLNNPELPATYTIYSYGLHYPLYVYDYEACQWYGNKDGSSQTTNRHRAKFKPHSVAQWVDTATLDRISFKGIVNTTAERMEQ